MSILVLGFTSVANAAPLTAATFTAPEGYRYTGAENTRYDWGFTTATSATLSKVTASVPPGTGGGNRYLTLPDSGTNYASAPDPSAHVSGDLDVRVRMGAANWSPSVDQQIVRKNGNGGDYSWGFKLDSTGTLQLNFSVDGIDGPELNSTVSVPFGIGEVGWVRATLQINNGSGGKTLHFYTSNNGTAWTQLGSPVVNNSTGIAPLYNNSSPLEIGTSSWGAGDARWLYLAEVRNGINGTVINRFDPNETNPASPSSWTSSTGEVWTIHRGGSSWTSDITMLLSATVTGVPSGGLAYYRFIDGIAAYDLPAPTSVSAGTAVTMNLGGFTNTSTAGSYPSTIRTYNSAGPPVMVDSATTAPLEFIDGSHDVAVSVEIEPSLTFTVAPHSGTCNGVSLNGTSTGAAIDLGRINSANGTGAQMLSVATNAVSGFSVSIKGSGPLTSAGSTIADVSAGNFSPAAFPTDEAFGYTTSDSSLGTGDADRFTTGGGNRWAALTTSNAEVMAHPSPTNNEAACVGFQAGVGPVTPAGVYQTAVTYTALARY